MNNTISDISDFEAVWAETQLILRRQMTQATYDMQIRELKAISLEDDLVTLQASGSANLDWLEYRLREQIERGLSQVAGRAWRVQFWLPPARPENKKTPPPAIADGTMLSQVNHALAGFNQYTHYLIRFWRSYIGANAFDLWQYVRSYCKDGGLTWTPERDFTGAELARGADCGKQRITGVWRGCPQFDRALEEGRMLERCCRQYDYREEGEWPGRTKPTLEYPEGRPTCRHWVHGALEILEAEGLAVFVKRGDHPRNTFYTIQVYQHPPVLTPRQVERFDNKMRIGHRRMLYGLLRAHQEQQAGWQYGLDAWERETSYSGLAAMSRQEMLAGLTLPLPEVGVLSASALNHIFFECSSSAGKTKGTRQA